MDPQSSKIELKVGIFVVIGLIATMVSILLLGGDKIALKKRIEYHAQFTEVQGLFPGSVVSLSGLNIGNVKHIALNDDLKIDLTMQVDPAFAGRITAGAIVEIKTQGALGDKFLYIKPGPPTAAVIADGGTLPVEESDFLKLLIDRKDGMARAVDLVKELHILVGSLNQDGKTAKMMSNMAEASEKLKSTMGKLDSLLGELHGQLPEDKKLKKALIALSSILEKVDKGQGTLGQLINDPSVHQSLKAFLGASQRGRLMKDLVRETIQAKDEK